MSTNYTKEGMWMQPSPLSAEFWTKPRAIAITILPVSTVFGGGSIYAALLVVILLILGFWVYDVFRNRILPRPDESP